MAWPIGQAILLIGGDCVYKTSVTGSTPTIRKNSPLQKERRVFLVAGTGCGCPVDTSVHSTEAPTEAAAESLNQRSCI